MKQLQNTTEALLKIHPDAKIELRLFLDTRNFNLLEGSGEVYGWRMNGQRHLGWINRGTLQWVDALIEGVNIVVQIAP